MAFRFPLAAVLRLREIAEEREERLLSGILLQMSQLQVQIEQADAAIAQLSAARAAALSGITAAGELQLFYERQAGLEASRRLLQDQLARLEELRLHQLGIYQRAHRGRRMLTEMKADQQSAWESERARTEQKTADDLYLARRIGKGHK